ncbi:hypothetical protein BSKO_00179 [Bryopsis sp. KO-2023]|nr:hypothetical protein BSKO_00179 [Bryopsis sp. KO-2023]
MSMSDGHKAASVIRSTQKLAWDLKNRIDEAKSAQKCGHLPIQERCAAALLREALTKQLNDVLIDLAEISELIQQAICKSHGKELAALPAEEGDFIELLERTLVNWNPRSHDVIELKSAALKELKKCPSLHSQTDAALHVACLREVERLGKRGGNAQPQKLKRVMHDLRMLETDLSFHGGILHDAASLSSSTSYKKTNFAYGSTPLSSWMKVCEHPKVKPLLMQSLKDQKLYMVWGSSSGWLVFYGALAYGFKSVGVELMKTNVASAREIAEQNEVESIEFLHGDLLDSDLSNVGVLVLTSQCWDVDLVAKASAKIALELPPGAVCIDYTPALIGSFGQPLACINIPVSWNKCQKMHVFVKH